MLSIGISMEGSPSLPKRSASRVFRDKLNKSSPPVFNTGSEKQGHIRSSSLGSFVSRLLPSHRQEKGHTLRSDSKDDSTQDAVGLVFNVTDPKPHKTLPEHICINGKTTASGVLWKNTDSINSAQTMSTLNYQSIQVPGQLEHARRCSDGDRQRTLRRDDQTRSIELHRSCSPVEKKKDNTLKRIIGSLKRSKEGKGKEWRDSEHNSTHQTGDLAVKEMRYEIPGIFSDKEEISKTQQLYNERRLRREQRRSLKESGDFLGVQGANPRTGYWDLSDATSSSEPSQMSENTKLKLDQQARELAEQREKNEETRKSHQGELKRVQTMKETKKKEKEELKKSELKLRQRYIYGRWKLGENGWSSIAEPELSPIPQSVSGSPIAELAPGDRLLRRPGAAEPSPYVNNVPIRQGDYFGHRPVSSPLARQLTGKATNASFHTARSISIPRKPIGSPNRQRTEESSETIIHNNSSVAPVEEHQLSPGNKQQAHPSLSVDPVFATLGRNLYPNPSTPPPFLGKEVLSSKLASLFENKATAISFRSVSMKQAVIHRPLAQRHNVRRIISLNKLPPVSSKDPIAASIPSSCLLPKGLLITWVPPKIIKTKPGKPISFINTSTITTTGCAPLQRLVGQVDGASDFQSMIPTRQKSLQLKFSQIPLRTSSHHPQSKILRETLRKMRQTYHADTSTSSEHQLRSTKERSVRLCLIGSPEGDKMELKSIPISISTCHQSPEKQKEAAKNAALLAIQQSRRQVAIKKTEGQKRGQLTLPQTRKQNKEDARHTKTKMAGKSAQDENGDIEGRSQFGGDPVKDSKASHSSAVCAAWAATSKIGASNTLAVWYPEPSAEKGVKDTDTHMKAVVLIQRCGLSSRKEVPTPGAATRSMVQIVASMAHGAWLIVVHVFNPQSGVRKRLELGGLTWQDLGWFVAAAMFTASIFLATACFERVWGIGLLGVRAFAAMFWLFHRILNMGLGFTS